MLFAYINKPIRDTVWKEWKSDGVPLSIDDSLFPDLTFKDEPLEVKLQPVITDLDIKAQEYDNKVTNNEDAKKKT